MTGKPSPAHDYCRYLFHQIHYTAKILYTSQYKGGKMYPVVKGLLTLLYPRRCPVCDDVVYPMGKTVCDECSDILSPLSPPLCFKCGKKLENDVEEYCENCKKHSFSFDRAFSLWSYNEIIRNSLSRFKYKNRREFADYYSENLFKHFHFLFSKEKISAIIPVPIHINRRRERGYNQAELITRILSEKSGIPEVTDYLIRVKSTKAQNTLDPSARKKNLNGAFLINKSSKYYNMHLNSVLLVDDIYTTGNTADICSETLKKSGVSKVYVLCIASV